MTINNCLKLVQLDLSATTDITTLFSHIAEKPWSIMLDSSNSEHSDGRYDIIVANPIISITTKDEVSCIQDHQTNDISLSKQNPLELIEHYQNELLSQTQLSQEAESSEIPFLCGALGYWGYDLGRRFEKLPSLSSNQYSSPDMAIGIYSWSIIKDNKHGQWFLSYVEGLPYPGIDQVNTWAESALAQNCEFELQEDWQSNLSEAKYLSSIERIKQYLVDGDCYQVNMTQRFSAPYSGCEWRAYQALRQKNKAPFSAFIKLPESTILSVSPERFLSIKDGMVETKPIKGTRPRHADEAIDLEEAQSLKQSEKDRAENLMIVDLLRNDLSKSCAPGSVRVPSLFEIESFPAVHHLVSKVTGQLKEGISAVKLLQGAFPGGSITGAPKIRAMEIIEELEPDRRNIYCGSIGYIGIRGDADTSICIRTLLCENQTIYCWAGGGIVLDSVPELEYQECHHKVSKILPILRQSNT